MMMAKNKLKVYGLFTGGGGLDIGFKEAGYELIGASDVWEESQKTMELNFPSIPFISQDITTLTAEHILKSTKGVKPDVIIGGPPCQGFSVMGDKNSADPRNSLFEAYVRIVDDLQPKSFVFENVKGIKTMFKGRYLKMVANSFSKIGYDIYIKVLNSKDFGVPQKRERVIIVGTRLNKEFKYPSPSSKSIGALRTKTNVEEAIGDLVNKGDEVPNHQALAHGEIVLKRYALIPEGGKLPPPEKLPLEIRRKNFGNTYTRLDRKSLSPTMVPGNNAFPVHPVLDRSLTPREAARIQSFPDHHIFTGSRKDQCILVGNAVPPLMAAHLAKEIEEHIVNPNYSGNTENLLIKRHSSVNINERISTKNLSFLDLFSGAGGIGIGYEKAGFEHLLSSDYDDAVSKTFVHNNPNVPYVKGDLSHNETFIKIKEIIGDKPVDVIVGGPPCQGFSMFGRRRFVKSKSHDPFQDIRNDMIFTFLDYVKEYNPKWVMMENVAGLVNLADGFYLEKFTEEIEKLGYLNHDFKVINTADYGVPQKRRRFIFLANRTGNIIPWPKPKFYAEPEDWQKPYRTINQVLVGLDSKKSISKFHNHVPMNHSPEVVERFSYIEEGKKINPELLPDHLKYSRTGKPIKSFSKVLFRLDRNQPSHTLVPGHSAFPIHPWLNRQLTVREAARIQTFPDEVEFLGTNGQQCKQAGNAFPPMAAEVFANLIAKTISNDWKEENLSNLAKYSLTR